MALQIFNPVDSDDGTAVASVDATQVASELIARCIAEVKWNSGLDSENKDGDWLAAAMRLADEASDTRRGPQKVKLKELEVGRQLQTAKPAIQKAAVLITLRHAARQNYKDRMTDRVCESVLSSLLRKKLPYTDAEIVQLLLPFAKVSFIITGLPIAPVLTNVERHVAGHGLQSSVRQQLQRMTKEYNSRSTYNDARKAGERVEALLAMPARAKVCVHEAVPRCGVAANTLDLNTGEAWTNALRFELSNLPDKSRTRWIDLLDHCATAKNSKPTKKFIKQAALLLDEIGPTEFIKVVSPTLEAIGRPGECELSNQGGRLHYSEPTEIHAKHVDRLRGLVWTTSLVNNESLIGVIGDAAEKCFQKIREVGPRSPKIGNACLLALSTLASDWAVAQLGRLKSRAKHVSTRKQIAKAFQQAASNAGMTEDDLIEISVPTFGLSGVGQLNETFGTFAAEATFHAHQKHQLLWRRQDGKTQKTVPSVVKEDHGPQLKRLKKKLQEIDKLMPSIRHRIEHLLLSERSWNLSDFRKRFLNHPLVGVIARRLIWVVEQDGETTAAVWHDSQWKTSANKSLEDSDNYRISIWHPMRWSADEVLQWRQWLESANVSQPFKQAHREVYILTDAERATVDHSNRFASHIIRQHQFAALCQHRGWRFDLQGDWDSWNAPYLDLPQHGLQVALYVDPMEDGNDVTPAFVYTHLATEQVQFFRSGDGGPDLTSPLPLEAIDPVVFSEVMRDVDLFVGVASIGNDPEWLERGAGGEHADYWQQFSFGALSETAVTRKQTLQQLLPRLEIADQCRLDGRFLVVEGLLRTYKIHLGTSNVLMSPNDQYLCVVQKRGSGAKRTDNLFLPFEGDNTLSLILSKAFMLAEDDKIKDATIANQIRSNGL